MNVFLDELYRIFFGSGINIHYIFEIFFRTSFMYIYAILNVRLMDKRSMGLLTPFEIIIVIALGTAVSDPMFYPNIPLLQGMIVISTIVFIERILTKISMKSVVFERMLNGEPTLIITYGELQKKAMNQQNISEDELYSMLRLRGIKNIAEIERAYLEPSGSISIIRKNNNKDDDIVVQDKRNLLI